MLYPKSHQPKSDHLLRVQSPNINIKYIFKGILGIEIALLFIFILLIGLSSGSNSINNSALGSFNQSSNFGPESSLSKGDGLFIAEPEALVVLPEQILPKTVIISMAAIYNNTSAIFLINNTTINGNNIIIEAFSLYTKENHTAYTILPAQITLNDLSIGKYTLEIKDRLTGRRLTNSSFSVRPFGLLFSDDGFVGHLETYRGGMVNNTMYLITSPLNPICPPGLFNYTHVWANSTDQFFIGFNISSIKRNISDLNLSISSKNLDLKVSPSNGSIKLLNNSASRLMLFDIEAVDLRPGVYNLTYNLSYKKGLLNNSFKGEMPVGIYRMSTSFGVNDTINTDFISPFNDSVNRSAEDWTNYTINNNSSVWLPNTVLYNGSYSKFSLQKPRSPWLHVVIGAAIGGVVGTGAELAHQCLIQQKLSMNELGKCKVDWTTVAWSAAKTGVAGAALAAIGPAAIPGKIIEGTVVSVGLNAAEQSLEVAEGNKRMIDPLDMVYAAYDGAVEDIAFCGASKVLAGSVAMKRGIAEGLSYESGSWSRDVFAYIERSPQLTRAKDIIKDLDVAKKLKDYAPLTWKTGKFIGNRLGNFIVENTFKDEMGTHIITTTGQLQGFDSPSVGEQDIRNFVSQGSENPNKNNQANLTPPKAQIAPRMGNAPAVKNSKGLTSTNSEPSKLVRPLELVLAVDESGSMGCQGNLAESKLNMAKDTARNFANLAPIYGNILIGVVAFAGGSEVESDLGASTNDIMAGIDEIEDSSCDMSDKGDTSFGSGLQEALSIFEKSQLNSRKAIIFMSDGHDNQHPDPQPYIEECQKRNIAIYTIGFGPDADEKLLRAMADQTGGTYSFSNGTMDFVNSMIESFDLSAGWSNEKRYNGTISQGETKEAGGFSITNYTESAKITLNWPGSDLDLILIDPNGNAINGTNGTDSNIVYSGQNSKPKYIILRNPLIGNWTMKVQGKDVPEGSTNYTMDFNELAQSANANGQLPAKDLLYSDDFSNPRSGWSRYSTQDVNYTYDKGKYHINILRDNKYFVATHEKQNFNDFVMEVKAAKDDGTDRSRYGIVFRYLDQNNFYRFCISNNGNYRIDGEKGGSWFTVIDWTKSSFIHQDNASNLLQMKADGGKFAFYINGVKLAETFDRTFNSGLIGLFGETNNGGNARFSFDDLKVWSIIPDQPYGEISIGNVLYSENFSSNSSFWPTYKTNNESYAYDSGRYALTVLPKNSYSIKSLDKDNISDFIIQVEAGREGGADPSRYGVVLRYLDENNFYRFYISSDGYYKFDGKKDGSLFTVIDWTKSEAIETRSSTNILQVAADGEKFTFYINGIKVADASDSTFSSGRIGIIGETTDHGNAQVSFDNLKIWSMKR